MSRELVCITCPIGCRLNVESLPNGEIGVSGNRCPRGAVYAREEILAPKRMVTATCGAARPGTPGGGLSAPRRIPCRSTAAIPKERVPDLLKAIYALEVSLPVKRGTVLLADALGMGINVVATRDIDPQ
jgi:CxxC motif-containing protein